MSNSLSKNLRNQLAKVTLAARECADKAVRAALENLAVHEKDYRPHMAVADRELRNRLRARGRALGDPRDERSGTQRIDHLAEHAAYEHWHRILFTRFLVESGLLYSDAAFGNVPVTLKDCDELAADAGARDGFDLACRFASRTLPGVFRQDDPVLELRLAPNDETALRALLSSLPVEVFHSDDGLGWTYQFWQAQRKDEVNASGDKVGADELPAVTQLFTEDYMVEFLLHNTLGAWWAARVAPIRAATEGEARAQVALTLKEGLSVQWTYLRLHQDSETKTWSPALGVFHGWPAKSRLISFLDPCMGSGHFLICALPVLARMRMEEEELSAAQAITATLSENLFGLELDERCAQIAAFNLALTAWKLAGHQSLPTLHLACSGGAPRATEKDWIALAGSGDDRLRKGIGRLYAMFQDAPILGSLIDPRAVGGNLIEAQFAELQPLLDKALSRESKNPGEYELAVNARGLAKAAEILSGQFTLVATNVPYLARTRHPRELCEYSDTHCEEARTDLATVFVSRCIRFAKPGGSVALVTPQNWNFQDHYEAFRSWILETVSLQANIQLGAGAFDAISGEVVKPALVVASRSMPGVSQSFLAGDLSSVSGAEAKGRALVSMDLVSLGQREQINNPRSRVLVTELVRLPLLNEVAGFHNGICSGDLRRFTRGFWELDEVSEGWAFQQTTTAETSEFGGMHNLFWWQNGSGDFYRFACERLATDSPGAWIRGKGAWTKEGVLVSAMGSLQVSRYLGDLFDDNTVAIVPLDKKNLPAIWEFCSSSEYPSAVRQIDQSLKVRGPLVEVPFDLARWRGLAAKKYPKGLPHPSSKDPTQWLHCGHPRGSDQPLHVAVARLLGYLWPRQTGSAFRDCPALGADNLVGLADDDGIVCLQPISREPPAASRLRTLLARALGAFDERALLDGAGLRGSSSSTLETWLRDEFFDQHCDLFHQRPFVWHVWDGRKDGFHALVNCHRFDHAALQKLAYSYLGDWIRQQGEDAKADKVGAAERLGAAQSLQEELARILEGEAPYDIFVRWKPLSKQAIGWQPSLNDGVRVNIRPFLRANDVGKKGAGLLRSKPKIKWEKDRGTEPLRDKAEFPWFWCEEEPDTDPKPGRTFGGNRWNDVHLSLDAKRAARKK